MGCTEKQVSKIKLRMMSSTTKQEKLEIEVIDNGPLHISGIFEFSDPKRNLKETTNDIYLCRCFRSSNLPYCDGTHKRPHKDQ